ncbi:MAG: beta-propeller domain-containing protein [Phycisphaerae bacterium]|nr:beta-propeller domain-containing protein [Phycisphaerae bacterium]
MRRASLAVVIMVTGLMSTGCHLFWPFNPDPPKKTGAAALLRFKSEAELKQYLADQVKARSAQDRTGYGLFSFLLPMAAGAPAPTAGDASNDQSFSGGENKSGDDYSTTNLQEEGVDESDVMKNDANYVYALSEGKVRIAKVDAPAAMAQVSELEVDGTPENLYLRGDQLVALSRKGSWYWYDDVRGGLMVDDAAEASVGPGKSGDTFETVVTLIDVSDRQAPKIVKTYEFEGSIVSSRMVGGRLHLILAYYPQLPAIEQIPNAPLSSLLPKYAVEEDGKEASVEPSLIAGWQDWYRPADGDGYGMLTVATINTEDPNAEISSVGLTADAGLVYASPKALYLTDTEWGYSSDEAEQTIIHKFAFTDSGAEYVSSGSVPGRPLNQFSLGEHEDYLRIATTLGRLWSGGGGVSNNVFVLGEGAKSLEVVGELRGIAEGEEIYAARFIGSRGFLVTFVKIDPLFTLDLSDPTKPKVVGELKVPGYSDYIHLLDENHLLTIGKDADATEANFSWYQGVQLSIFDVTDFANPQLLHKKIIGGRGTESAALNDHRAFNFFAPKKLLAIPIDLYEGGSGGPTYGEHTFSGLYVYRVTSEDGFDLQGRISTIDALDNWYYYSSWTRGVFIGDYVYAVTDERIRSAGLGDVNTVLDTLELGD